MKTLQKKEVPKRSLEEVQDNKENQLKILAICGSPRKGNTYKVLKSIKATYPNIDITIMRLSKMNLKPCKGNYKCVHDGEEHSH